MHSGGRRWRRRRDEAAALTALACIALPLLLAAADRWLPPLRALAPAVAAITLALTCSLPWTGAELGGWLLLDPLAVHVAVLTGFAWLAASAYCALDGPDVTPAVPALMTGCVNLALLSDGGGLTLVAAGVAGMAAAQSIRLPAPSPLVTVVACGLGVALFGLAVLGSATARALGPGWASLSWSALPGAGPGSTPAALGVAFVALLLGLGCACTALPVWAAVRGVALPRTMLMLSGPLSGVWLVVALRLRGVLDGNGQAVAPGGLLMLVGFGGLLMAPLCLLGRDPNRLLPAATVGMLGAALVGFGLGGAAATGAALLHFTLACLLLTAAAAGGWPAHLGAASLAVLPPFALFGSGLALLTAAASRQPLLGLPLGLGLAGLALAALRLLPPPGPGRPAARLGWAGLALALAGAWAMPPGLSAWMQGIAAAAR